MGWSYFHGIGDDEGDAILEEIRKEYRNRRCCDCGGELVAQSGGAGLVVVCCAECDALYAEVEL